MKALVTGGAGFIGSHIIDRLLNDGYTVTSLDNMSIGTSKNIEHLKNNRKFKHKTCDLRNKKDVIKATKGYDVIFHIAAFANLRKSLIHHYFDLENNLITTVNIFEAMLKNEINDIVFSSTSSVYGNAQILPTPETYHPTQTSLYGASKISSEAFAEAYTNLSNIKLCTFRFSNVIGPRCRRGVIWDFVHKLNLNPKQLDILGNGKQSKEYIHVRDCIDGIMLGYKKSRGKVNIFNLGVEDNMTVDEVADVVIKEMKLKNVKRTYTGTEAGWIGDNAVVQLDLTKIKRLGWKQTVPAERAVAETTRWTLDSLM
jgi:UDP-glucose 4-epimerase